MQLSKAAQLLSASCVASMHHRPAACSREGSCFLTAQPPQQSISCPCPPAAFANGKQLGKGETVSLPDGTVITLKTDRVKPPSGHWVRFCSLSLRAPAASAVGEVPLQVHASKLSVACCQALAHDRPLCPNITCNRLQAVIETELYKIRIKNPLDRIATDDKPVW